MADVLTLRRSGRTGGERDLLVVGGLIGVAVVIADTVAAGLPSHPAGRIGVVVLTAAALTAWGTVLRRSIRDVRVLVPLLLGAGLAGAWLNVLSPAGPGFLIAYLAMAGIGLRLPRRVAVLAGVVVLVAVGLAQGATSPHPLASVLDIALGAGFLFVASAFAGVSRDASEQARRLLEQEQATREAREHAAVLAERSRLARELHDVLAHSLAGLAVQLEGARLLATKTGADSRLVEQLTAAQRIARDGLVNARSAVSTLRGDGLPGPAEIPQLVEQARAAGSPVTFQVAGQARPIPAETGLAVYRAVQEALTNVAKHAGPGSPVDVRITWSPDEVRADVVNRAGGTPAAGLPSSGYGLAGLSERAALAGGRLEAGPDDDGWRVRLVLPIPAAQEVRR